MEQFILRIAAPPTAAQLVFVTIGGIFLILIFAAPALIGRLRRRGLTPWLGSYILQSGRRRAARAQRPRHLILAICDHYEPQHGKVPADRAMARVESWTTNYPKLFERFRDADGRPPRHSFFFPLDEYDPAHVDGIAGLCRAGYGEVEVHLHHDNDTADNLRQRLLADTRMFRERHGVLSVDQRTGAPRYGFIHGNWALDNSRPDGRWCGVNNELDILRETGCYADFTMPSYPSDTQTRKINSIYYAVDDPARPKSHDYGIDVGTGPKPDNALLLIQGPLVFNWQSRKVGLIPRIENGNIQHNQPATIARLDSWLKARVQVPRRPDWFFVKLHTHGAPEKNQAVLLGDPMVRFHEDLAQRASADSDFHIHYVTAREMYNLVKAAEAGWEGTIADARDFELAPPEPFNARKLVS
jgi:hypothetical protein